MSRLILCAVLVVLFAAEVGWGGPPSRSSASYQRVPGLSGVWLVEGSGLNRVRPASRPDGRPGVGFSGGGCPPSGCGPQMMGGCPPSGCGPQMMGGCPPSGCGPQMMGGCPIPYDGGCGGLSGVQAPDLDVTAYRPRSRR